MATFLGTHITKFDSTPFDVVDSRLHGGTVKSYVDAFELADTANNDFAIVFRLPIDAVVKRVLFGCDALGAGTADIGLYKKNNDGTYTAVDQDCFATLIAVTSAVAVTDVTYEAGATNIANARKALWEIAGLSTRPEYGDLYVTITTPTGTSTVGTVYLELETVE